MVDAYLEMPETYAFLSFFAFVFGANMGSFLNVCIWRIPRGESIVHPPSQCPNCHNRLKPWHNIPIIGWLSLRGKCAFCKTPISARYIMMEIVTGLIFLITWFHVTQNKLPIEYVLFYWAFCSLLLVASMIDFDLQIIPDKITKFGIGLGLITCVAFPVFQSAEMGRNPILPFQGQIVVPSLTKFFSVPFPEIPWFTSGFNSLVGAILGFFVINCVIEIGKIFYGKKLYQAKDGRSEKFTFNKEKVVIDGDELQFDDLFMREKDVIELTVDTGSMRLIKDGTEIQVPLKGQLVCVNENHIEVGKEKYSIRDLVDTEGEVSQWTIPQEVMGYGDAKLFALCGAFLGPEAIVYILTLSSVIGTIVLLPMQLFRNSLMENPFPFGPFIAFAAYLWIHIGHLVFSNLH